MLAALKDTLSAKDKSVEQKYLPIYLPDKSDMDVVLANMHE